MASSARTFTLNMLGRCSTGTNALLRFCSGQNSPHTSSQMKGDAGRQRDGRRRFYLTLLIVCTWSDFPIWSLFLFCTGYYPIVPCNARSFDR